MKAKPCLYERLVIWPNCEGRGEGDCDERATPAERRVGGAAEGYLVKLLADLVLLAVIVDVADVDALAVGGLAALVDHAGRRFCVRKWVAKVKIPRAQLPSAAQSRTTSSSHVEA